MRQTTIRANTGHVARRAVRRHRRWPGRGAEDIGFDTAKLIFEGTVATSPDRRRDCGEERRISIGRVEPGALIVVAHTERRGRIPV